VLPCSTVLVVTMCLQHVEKPTHRLAGHMAGRISCHGLAKGGSKRKCAHLARENRATGRLRVCSSAPLKDAIGPNPQPRNCSRRHEPGQAGILQPAAISKL